MSAQKTSTSPAGGQSHSVIAALESLEVDALSFSELRQLSAALTHLGDIVTAEIARRLSHDASGDTVRVAIPPIAK